jgi:hypothetical protein
MTTPRTVALINRVMREPRGRGFNRIPARTVQIQFLFSLLPGIGLPRRAGSRHGPAAPPRENG